MNLKRPVVAAIAVACWLSACGSSDGDRTTTSGGHAETTTKTDAGLRCTGSPASSARDRADDVTLLSATGPATDTRAPQLDLLAAAATKGGGAPLCFSIRTAAPLRNGTTVSFETIHRSGARYELEHYDVTIDARGRPTVSRPHGEPRYPVAAIVARHGDGLDVALLELPAPLGVSFGWKAETSDARPARDGLPSLTAERWVAFPSGRIVDASVYTDRHA